jgi:predicted NAD/FAD-binding protein
MTSPLQQKIKITGPSVVTANRTWDGVVIYRDTHQGWSTDLAHAAIVRTADEARALLAEATADDVGAIGPYIAPVAVNDNGTIEPGNLREQIRRQGVTIDLPASA